MRCARARASSQRPQSADTELAALILGAPEKDLRTKMKEGHLNLRYGPGSAMQGPLRETLEHVESSLGAPLKSAMLHPWELLVYLLVAARSSRLHTRALIPERLAHLQVPRVQGLILFPSRKRRWSR